MATLVECLDNKSLQNLIKINAEVVQAEAKKKGKK